MSKWDYDPIKNDARPPDSRGRDDLPPHRIPYPAHSLRSPRAAVLFAVAVRLAMAVGGAGVLAMAGVAELTATILAVRNSLAVLDGADLRAAAISDVFAVRTGKGYEFARLSLLATGAFPIARITRVQTGISAEALVGMEVERVE